ncbi:MAG TPA: response regulator transcription factor [Chthoniobacterales bacterium]|jgi:DNA-binding NarL/FixJ family response regulator
MKKTEIKRKSRILLVDDHALVRDGLAQLLRGEVDMMVCGEAGSAEQALDVVAQVKPDLAIVDISLGGANGIELIKNLKALRPDLRILVLSMHDEATFAERALRAGASGYVMKREARDRIMEGIRAVRAGNIYVSERLQKSMLHQYLHGSPTGETSPISRLSDRELEVLTLLGRGLSSKDIAESLHLSQKTIDSHRTHLKEKLNLGGAAELVRFAFEWVSSQES